MISIALESVDYNEERAEQILNAVLQEEATPKVVNLEVKETRRSSTVEAKKG